MLLQRQVSPEIDRPSESHNPSVEDQIYSLILKLRNTHVESGADHPIHYLKISAFVSACLPIHFVLPAFPAKSANEKKTFTQLPDYGEVLGLERMNNLCRAISRIYPLGARMTICADGRVFGDLVHVSDAAIDVYGAEIEKIIRERGLVHLNTFNLENVFSCVDYSMMRARLTKEFAEPLAELRERVRSESDTRELFNGIHRFILEDQLVLNPEISRSQNRLMAKALAYEVIQRSNAWSRVVEKYFPESVRLSIHPQAPSAAKIGVRLVESNHAWRTPWHSVAVYDGADFYLAPRAEVEERGGKVAYFEGKYPYFILKSREGI